MTSLDLGESITTRVRLLYEAFPYPSYPLLARPRWQEAYTASSLFAARLASDLRGEPSSGTHAGLGPAAILVAGSGEMQPYVMRRWEPSSHHISCVDLARRSLLRARFRLLGHFRGISLTQADIIPYLAAKSPASFDHAEAYGVLHHLADPLLACQLLWRALRPHASMRLMLYNTPARHWIHQLQAVFRLLGLSPYAASDRRLARRLLGLCALHLPALASKLQCLGQGTLDSDSRLVDTFFHARELRLSCERWLALLEQGGFRPLALFDRYAELDELPNPLWQPPSAADLQLRALDGRFENNLELVVVRTGPAAALPHRPPRKLPFDLRRTSPPLFWFGFRETRKLAPAERSALWQAYLTYVWNGKRSRQAERWIASLALPTRQRLARIGALLPGMLASSELRGELSAPMELAMEIPAQASSVRVQTTPLAETFAACLKERSLYSRKRLELILARLEQAQGRHLAPH